MGDGSVSQVSEIPRFLELSVAERLCAISNRRSGLSFEKFLFLMVVNQPIRRPKPWKIPETANWKCEKPTTDKK